MAKPKILLVDDNLDFLNSLTDILASEFHVIAAQNAKEALSIVNSTTFNLILLDLQMPEMTGVELVEKIRNTGNDIPVLIITGNSSQEWAEKYADCGVNGYIKKPVDIESLVSRIKKLLYMEEFHLLQVIWGSSYQARRTALSPVIDNAIRYIHKNYHQVIDRGCLAMYLNISPDYLSRKFRLECEINLVDYINMYKVNASKKYLMDTNATLPQIAMNVGIHDTNYFCKLFKKHTGVTPTEFRNISSSPQS